MGMSGIYFMYAGFVLDSKGQLLTTKIVTDMYTHRQATPSSAAMRTNQSPKNLLVLPIIKIKVGLSKQCYILILFLSF